MSRLLKFAIQNSDINFIKFLIKRGQVITQKDLNTCALYGNLSILKYICSKTDYYCNIDMACFYGHLDIVEYLLENNKFTYDKAFEFTAKNGHLEVLKLLIKHKIHMMSDLNNAIHLAAIYGHYDVVSLIFFLGGRTNEDTLEIISKNGYYDIVAFIYSLQTIYSNKAVFNAIKYKNYKIAYYLLTN